MSPDYCENGDFLGSGFSKDFRWFFDNDTVEVDKNSLLNAIEGYSYHVDIMSDMKEKSRVEGSDECP
ncbi:hypothetical protein PSCICE_12950 [Pseudomonas cichorii]|nr:hypothetical protein PSCICE_12950 [Pseudomonas cichorii]